MSMSLHTQTLLFDSDIDVLMKFVKNEVNDCKLRISDPE